MAANNTQASKSAVDVVKNLLKETVQIAQCEGEVSNVYPKVGELVGLGSPIMSISIMSDMCNLQCSRRPSQGSEQGR